MNIKEYLLSAMEEMAAYINNEDYSELEQHDCRVAYEVYQSILDYIESIGKENK